MPRWRSLVWLAAAAALMAGPLGAAITEVFPLVRGGAERALPRGAVHAYPVDLRAGEYLHLRADQLGVDLALRWLDPFGSELLRVDSPNGDRGPEDLFFVADRGGRYRAELTRDGGPSGGRYRIAILERRPAAALDRRRSAALLAFSQAGVLRLAGVPEPAAAAYQKSASLWQGLKEEKRRGDALNRWAQLRRAAQAPREAVTIYREALRAFQAAGDLRDQALMQNEIGQCEGELAHPEEASAAFEKALALWRQSGDREGLAGSLYNLARMYRQQGEYQKALDSLQEESAIAHSRGDVQQQVEALIGIGQLLADAGSEEAALDSDQQALALLAIPGGDLNLKANALNQLANAFGEAGSPRSALLPLTTVLGLRRRTGDVHGQAVALVSLGKVYFQLKDQKKAMDLHRKALQLFRQLHAEPDEAAVWSNLGWISWAQGRSLEALDSFQQALSIARAHTYRGLEAAILQGMARAERLRGNPIAARRRIGEAVGIVEEVRGELGTDLQLSYFAKMEDYYGVLIDLLMEQHRLQPAAGYDLAALEASEKVHARSLLDQIQRGGPPVPPLRRAEIQAVLDPDTLVLEFYLSEPHSYLWSISSNAVSSYELPGKRVIEAQAELTRLAASRGGRRQVAEERLRELGRTLLAPVARQLGGKRLLVVPSGILATVPFEALVAPPSSAAGTPRDPLLVQHEVSFLPSVSVLAALRRREESREPAPDLLALLADAVVSREDRRLPPAAAAAPLPPGLGGLSILQHAAEEAKAILDLAPRRSVLSALGFAASRDLFLSGVLSRYRGIHVATHGYFDEEHPERSALVLSLFDAAGRPRKGLVRPQEIERLRLAADLVVLSACRSGLGRQVAGEGMVGLARSFLAAGASRTVVSLWNVDDHATSVLMKRFYYALLHDGRAPAAALREAQLSMRQEERWRDPYHWAGFLMQGDWQMKAFLS
jgi:CHAT domain-containing protein